MLQNKYFRTCLGIIAFLLIVYLLTKISFLFRPFVDIFNLLLVPIALAGFFYYLLRPVVDYLEKRKIKRALAVLMIYFVFAALFALFIVTVWPTLREQIENFISNAPNLVQDVQKQMDELKKNSIIGQYIPSESELYNRVSEYANQAVDWVTNSMSNVISAVSNFFIIVATVPIILYYMLKESGKLPPKILGMLPRRYRREGHEVLGEMDNALSSFIIGKVILNLVLSVLIYIGFLIIGLPYSLLLTLISFVLNFIPYVGAILATIPVVIVGFIESPGTAIWSVVVIIAAQQIQDNILTPVIYGKQLDIHPLTTVVLILVGGNFYGMLGVLLAIPAYMVIKILIVRIYELFLAEKVENA
ncbi:AI-2E family transporter [Paenibacillus sp. F411]|uniref:AI-2E family transporter n=1 Tax=Paenibacillus algicola TaxID=2565926 RepID=A0A4P8XIX2_9BACL|nr:MULTISPECIES: AI-2E family transporter [Paenibacillus]MBO2944906.1 AI-2E family transporter [Paenibacillus sp. F411]QCT02298.1 hypothetical protein E6C60_1582 [Paenibacillus algicola]